MNEDDLLDSVPPKNRRNRRERWPAKVAYGLRK